jgi:hypothetical protein
MSTLDFDSSLPKLVYELLKYSRKYPWDTLKGISEESACRHDVFTFTKRPGWRIDAYQFGMLGLSTDFTCKVTAPDGQIEYCWFKSGIEFDEWVGNMVHYENWEQTPECKANTREEINEHGFTIRYPPPVPEYIEGCPCPGCNKEEYDGLVWKVGPQIDRRTPEQKKEAAAALDEIFDMFPGVPKVAMPDRQETIE